MKTLSTGIVALILVSFMVLPALADETNATTTATTTIVTETTAVETSTTEEPATTGVVAETTTVAAASTSTTAPVTTTALNVTTESSAPVTTVAAATPAVTEVPDTTGDLAAASSPLGAALLIDGAYYGITPVNLSGIPVGNHIVRLTLSGYYDYEGSVYVTPDKVTNVFGTLQPSGAPVTATLPAATTTAIPIATVQPTQTTAGSIFDSPAVVAAVLGIITACIGAGATIFTHISKVKKE